MHSKLINGIRSIIAAFLHQFTLYPLFMMSNIMPFMISYLYQTEKESSPDKTSSLTQDDGYFIHPIMSLTMSICCFFGGMIEHYLGPKLVVLIGGICLACGDFLFTISQYLILDFFTNIFFGVGFGVSMTAALKNATKYFPKKRGLINAIVGALGGNLGSSFFNLIIKYFVSKGDFPNSEDNNMYKKTTAENYKTFFYIHGIMSLGFAIISSLLLVTFKEKVELNVENKDNLLTENDEEKGEKEVKEQNQEEKEENDEGKEDNKEEKEDNNEVKNNNKENNNSLNYLDYRKGLKQVFKFHQIYIVLLIYLFTSFLQGFILTVGFNYGTMSHSEVTESEDTNKISPDEMSIIFMLSSLISSIMGSLFGLIYDKITFKYTMIIIDIISCINGILISFTVKWGVYYYAISIILNGCLNSGAFSMIFPHMSKIFGFNYAGELYGFVVLSTGINGIISSSIYYIISHFCTNENDINYFIIFNVGAVCNFIAAILAYFDNGKKFEFQKYDILENKL